MTIDTPIFKPCDFRYRLRRVWRDRAFGLAFGLIVGASSVAAGLPGAIDPGFLPGSPAHRGLLRGDGTIVLAGANLVTVVNTDGSQVAGPFQVPGFVDALPARMGLLADGSVVGGFESRFAGQGDPTTWGYLLAADGRFTTWRLGGESSQMTATHFSPLPDGRIVVAGFLTTGPTFSPTWSDLGILKPDLSFDPTPLIQCRGGRASRAGQVNGILQAGGGNYFAFGYFTSVADQPRNAIAKVLADGKVDPDFRPRLGLNSSIWGAAFQADGRIVVGGWLALPNLGNVAVARLLPDGTVDPSFAIAGGSPLDETVLVRSLAVDSQQRIIVSGVFDTLNGVSLPGLARLRSDGALDPTFQPKPPLLDRLGYGPHDYPDYVVDASDNVYGFGGAIPSGFFAAQETVRLSGGERTPSPPTIPVNTQRYTVADGGSVVLSAPVFGEPSPQLQWWRNGAPLAGATNPTLRLHAVSLESAGSYRIVASNSWGVTERQVASVAVNPVVVAKAATSDPTYRVTNDFTSLPAMASASDGGLLLALTQWIGATQGDPGEFVAGVRHQFPDGSTDGSFWTSLGLPTSVTNLISTLAPLPDGRTLVGGNFVSVNGEARRSLVRVLANGSVDASFADFGGTTGIVNCILPTANGSAWVGGNFNQFNGQETGPLVSLRADGRLDPEFSPPSFEAGETVVAAWLAPERETLIQTFSSLKAGAPKPRLALVGPNGGNLRTIITLPEGLSNLVVTVTPKARIVFSTSVLTNRLYSQISSIRFDGTPDPDFPPSVLIRGRINSLVADSSSRILVGGAEALVWPGRPQRYVLRLQADGTLDPTFDLSRVTSRLTASNPPLLLTPTGRVVVSSALGLGAYFNEDEAPSGPRLVAPLGSQDYELPTPGLTPADALVFTAPMRGVDLSFQWLFDGRPIPGSTQRTLRLVNPSLSQLGGYSVVASNSFGSVTSTVAALGPALRSPSVTTGAKDIRADWGQRLELSIESRGGWPLSFEWYRNGQPIVGENRSSLLIPSFSPADQGIYSAKVRNAVGATCSEGFRVIASRNLLSLSEAVDAPASLWTGTGLWIPQTLITSDGVDAVMIQPTSSETLGEAFINVSGPGTLTFQWKVDVVDARYSFEFRVDGQKFVPTSEVDDFEAATASWDPQTVRIPAGPHAVSWLYRWPASFIPRRGYLDQVLFTTDSPQPPVIVIQPVGQTTYEGRRVTLGVHAVGFTAPAYHWRKDGAEIPAALGTTLDLGVASAAKAGLYDVVVSSIGGSVTSHVARVEVRQAQTNLPAPSVDADGRASVQVPVDTALGFELQTSEDLEQWSSLPTWIIPNQNGSASLIDPVGGGFPQRFYRLKPLE